MFLFKNPFALCLFCRLRDETRADKARRPFGLTELRSVLTFGDIGGAGWSSPVARQAHNLKVVSSNLAPATKKGL